MNPARRPEATFARCRTYRAERERGEKRDERPGGSIAWGKGHVIEDDESQPWSVVSARIR